MNTYATRVLRTDSPSTGSPLSDLGQGQRLVVSVPESGIRAISGWARRLKTCEPAGCKTCATEGGFTLIEICGVLAVVLVLALALAPAFIRHYDRLAGQEETAALRTLSEGLRNSIVRNHVIPSATGAANWLTAIATELGVTTNSVAVNGRSMPRRFLIDPALQVGVNGGGLPYVQGTNGSQIVNGSGNVIAPISPRLMILACLAPSSPLPGAVVSGVAPSTGPYSFDNIWNAAEDRVPGGWTWSGRGEDLKIQRVNLDDLFVQIILNNSDQTNRPAYSVDGAVALDLELSGRVMYLIKNTQLGLLTSGGAILECSQFTQRSAAYSFELGSWRGGTLQSPPVNQLGPMDLQWAADSFLAAYWNQRAKNNPVTGTNTTQLDVYRAMISYMSNFCFWRDAGYPFQGNAAPKYMGDAQGNMDTLTKNLTF